MRSLDTTTQSDDSVISEIADGSQTPTAIMDAITPSPEDGLISLSEFQRIETGMNYREVTRIIG